MFGRDLMMKERCEICGCVINREGYYATPNVKGRSHATRHHHIAERFFGRSANRPGTVRPPIFDQSPWDGEGSTSVLCYECHEELIHNPVFLPSDIQLLSALVAARGLDEDQKTDDRSKIAGRIELLHDVIETGLKRLSEQTSARANLTVPPKK